MKHAKTVRKALGRLLWAAKRGRVPFLVLVQPRERGGLNLQDPMRKAAAMFVSRWETATRADMSTLTGCWLRHLQATFRGAPRVPACLAHFSESCRATLQAAPPLLIGRELTRSLYTSSLAVDVPVPRAMRQVDADVQQKIWRAVHTKGLPVDARSTWYEAVQDVLPTAIRLQAARQASVPDCPKCAEPEDVQHRLARCGAERRDAWSWLQQHVRQRTGVAIDVGTITQPVLPEGPDGAAAAAILGVAVHHLATRRAATTGSLQRHLKLRDL